MKIPAIDKLLNEINSDLVNSPKSLPKLVFKLSIECLLIGFYGS